MINYIISPEYGIGSLGMTTKYFKDGYWYKQNYNGCEGITEEICSALLSCSNLKPSEYVMYEACRINGKDGCRSKNFTQDREDVITFQRLYEITQGGNLKTRIAELKDPKEKFLFVVDLVKDSTGLDCTEYLNKNLYFDMLTFDVDRHFGNLALLCRDGEWREAPLFDFGASFFSLKHVFPDSMSVRAKIAKMTPQPFDGDFGKQAFAAGESILKFDYQKLERVLNEKPADVLSPELKELVFSQLERYRNIFEEKQVSDSGSCLKRKKKLLTDVKNDL